jgi:hypothetical protein
MLGELIELSQNSASASVFEAAALGLLQRDVGVDVAYFSVKGEEAYPTVVALDPPIVERAVARGPTYMQELLPVKLAALAARGVAVDTEVLGLGRVRETKYFRELGASVGAQHSLMAYLLWRNDVVAAIMLGRRSAFSASDIRRVESSLSGIAVGRAAFGLPWVSDPLRGGGQPALLAAGVGPHAERDARRPGPPRLPRNGGLRRPIRAGLDAFSPD